MRGFGICLSSLSQCKYSRPRETKPVAPESSLPKDHLPSSIKAFLKFSMWAAHIPRVVKRSTSSLLLPTTKLLTTVSLEISYRPAKRLQHHVGQVICLSHRSQAVDCGGRQNESTEFTAFLGGSSKLISRRMMLVPLVADEVVRSIFEQ